MINCNCPNSSYGKKHTPECYEALEAENRSLQADAQRYRWLRSQGFSVCDATDESAEWSFTREDAAAEVDASIDSFMRGSTPDAL